MAWRDDEARSSLIRDAARALPAGTAPANFVELLYGRTSLEDLALNDAASLASLAGEAWAHIGHREKGRHDLRVFNPQLPDGREITVVEILNDNMPFLFDSTMAELAERGLEAKLVAHPILALERDENGRLTHFYGGPGAIDHAKGERESLIHIHIDRIDADAERAELIRSLSLALDDVRSAVVDWRAMRGRVEQAVEAFKNNPPPLPVDEIAEANQLLQWLVADNFTFLGIREYRFASDDMATADVVDGSGLGILRDPSVMILRRGAELVAMTPEIREFMREPTVLIVTKANVKSRVHRRVHMDYVGAKLYSPDGRLEGELRIVGLFTSTAYTRSVRQIPYLRHKTAQVLARAGFEADSHSGKALINILENYPRDELFQVDIETLYGFVMEILMLYERPRIRVLARADRFDRFVSVLLFVPRDKYDTEARIRIGQYLATIYNGRVSAAYPSYPEGPLARVHFIIGRSIGATPDIDRATLEAAIAQLVESWADKLKAALIGRTDGMRARLLGQRYGNAFTGAYQEAFEPVVALDDIAIIERLSAKRPVAIEIYRRAGEEETRLSLKVFAHGAPLPLSYRVPIIENHGIRVVNERTYRVSPQGNPPLEQVWLHDMTLEAVDGQSVDLTSDLDGRLEASIMAVLQGRAESDGYNALVLRTDLGWRDVATIRTLSLYLRQIRAPFSQDYMWTTLQRNIPVVRLLAALFRTRFDPHLVVTPTERAAREAALVAEVETALKAVTSLDEDRILRRFLNLLQAAVRTNLWQIGSDGEPRPTIAFKFESRKVDGMPAPRPLYEIFVYSPRVEGVHLRFGKVARGGLRWSDRPQDFRTEVLGLVKAQQVKNAVIVPVGAKGGFVPKRLPPPGQRDAWLAEGTEAYRIFVRTLLELTDNLEGSGITPPADTVRHDGDDPYLVVAADKGTATFSDTANTLSLQKGHWLGDAFASGGSQGYDHKKMGITARGAWEAVKRHFREIGTDIQTTPFSAVGVGDMSGDVFGNGMLLSTKTRLLAAFDHRDIFLDPDPDPEASHAERLRLFALPRSSWQDYDKALISEGGGVFSRSMKAIPLSAPVRAMLGLDQAEATPFELMSAILKAPVDLLFFGGIGTYVRATSETDEQVGDRANDPIRITGADVRAKVIGEGANLGMTQRARVEAGLKGVRLNTDAIDNSAGVNTSDVEVNIKIALSKPERDGRLPQDDRNALLVAMTDEVAALVLRNNYLQTLSLSLTQRRGAPETGALMRLMQVLEGRGLLDRPVEFLPDDVALLERQRRGIGVTRPELAVLLAYAKITLYDDLLLTDIPDDPYLARELGRYFPKALTERFADAVDTHRLRREIIATQLANSMINRGGPAYVTSLIDRTGADVATVAMAFAAVRDSFRMVEIHGAIDGLDARIDGAEQLALYGAVQDLLLSRSVWFIRNVDRREGLEKTVERYRAGIDRVTEALDGALPPALATSRQSAFDALTGKGMPADRARRLADLPSLVAAPDIVLVAERSGRTIKDATITHFAAEALMRLDRIVAPARAIPVADTFDRLAIDRSLDQIETAMRRLVADMLKTGKAGAAAISDWLATHPEADRIRHSVDEIASGGMTLAKLTVAANLLGDLARD